MKKCPSCGEVYYKEDDYYCLSCNYRLEICSNQKIEQDQIKQIQNKNHLEEKHIPKCPTCGSVDIKKISTASKVFGAAMFGLFSKTAHSQFECKNCHYKW